MAALLENETLAAPPKVDNQGNKEVCVKAAASKAVVGGLWSGKWTNSNFDADQAYVAGLLHGDSEDSLISINPCSLDGRVLKIQDKEENNNWTEFILKIEKLEKLEFLSTWKLTKNKEYLVGRNKHCYYVEEIKEHGEKLSCLNSWGDENDPRPEISTRDLADGMIFAVSLLPLKNVVKINQDGKSADILSQQTEKKPNQQTSKVDHWNDITFAYGIVKKNFEEYGNNILRELKTGNEKKEKLKSFFLNAQMCEKLGEQSESVELDEEKSKSLYFVIAAKERTDGKIDVAHHTLEVVQNVVDDTGDSKKEDDVKAEFLEKIRKQFGGSF